MTNDLFTPTEFIFLGLEIPTQACYNEPVAPVKCFLVEDMKVARFSLRRYASGPKCSGRHGYHTAMGAVLAELPNVLSAPADVPERPARDHQGWPRACDCGYAFTDEDEWQVFQDALYRGPSGDVWTRDQIPAGGVYFADWWPDRGADGKNWAVVLPDGTHWMTESKANNCDCPSDPSHRCWKRSGTAPELTVKPSLQVHGWHGFLTDGILRSC